MGNNECLNCREHKRCKDSFASWIFFIIGLVATIAIRAVTLLIHANPIYAKIAWYVGVGGFFLFFMYRFKVHHARSKLVERQGLVHKIRNNKSLTESDYDVMASILCALRSKKEMVNYIVIFVLSGIAIALAVYMDFFKG